MNLIWKIIAYLVALPFVSAWIWRRAVRTPYIHLDGYMNRYWLFNPYQHADGAYIKHGWLRRLLPSVRVHHILRGDRDDHLHDHPWNARTIILSGYYRETRLVHPKPFRDCPAAPYRVHFYRAEGDTAAIRFGEYHSIDEVSPGGVVTLFFTWKYRGVWGFLVDGVKVPWRQYLGEHQG